MKSLGSTFDFFQSIDSDGVRQNIDLHSYGIWEMAKGKVFARDPIFGGSCVSKSLPLQNSSITKMLQVA